MYVHKLHRVNDISACQAIWISYHYSLLRSILWFDCFAMKNDEGRDFVG